jgi:hypothetical protein
MHCIYVISRLNTSRVVPEVVIIALFRCQLITKAKYHLIHLQKAGASMPDCVQGQGKGKEKVSALLWSLWNASRQIPCYFLLLPIPGRWLFLPLGHGLRFPPSHARYLRALDTSNSQLVITLEARSTGRQFRSSVSRHLASRYTPATLALPPASHLRAMEAR